MAFCAPVLRKGALLAHQAPLRQPTVHPTAVPGATTVTNIRIWMHISSSRWLRMHASNVVWLFVCAFVL